MLELNRTKSERFEKDNIFFSLLLISPITLQNRRAVCVPPKKNAHLRPALKKEKKDKENEHKNEAYSPVPLDFLGKFGNGLCKRNHTVTSSPTHKYRYRRKKRKNKKENRERTGEVGLGVCTAAKNPGEEMRDEETVPAHERGLLAGVMAYTARSAPSCFFFLSSFFFMIL